MKLTRILRAASKRIIDLRSDVRTIPTQAMHNYALQHASYGDDVFAEDQSTNTLQQYVADLTGKQAGLFVCSGVMSNQLAMRVHLNPLESVILDRKSHINGSELGGVEFHTGAKTIPIDAKNGEYITADEIEKMIHTERDDHHVITKLISLENTQDGKIFPISEIEKIYKLAKKYKLLMHLDGARLWNACVETNIPIKEWCKFFDTVSLCLSKGLGAGIGSVLVGTREHIEKARAFRKLYGGGWRKPAYLACCGLYAIQNHWERMKEDHENAKWIKSELEKIPQLKVVSCDTNMVFVKGLERWKKELEDEGILVMFSKRQGEPIARIVLHLDIKKEDVQKFIQVVKRLSQNS